MQRGAILSLRFTRAEYVAVAKTGLKRVRLTRLFGGTKELSAFLKLPDNVEEEHIGKC